MATQRGCALQPRRIQPSLLHQTVRGHWKSWLAEVAQRTDGGSFPGFVLAEFERYLKCGVLAHGFARVRCGDCHEEMLVGLSCKGRGFCPSCTTRRRQGTATHLVDRVIPRAMATRCASTRCRSRRTTSWGCWCARSRCACANSCSRAETRPKTTRARPTRSREHRLTPSPPHPERCAAHGSQSRMPPTLRASRCTRAFICMPTIAKVSRFGPASKWRPEIVPRPPESPPAPPCEPAPSAAREKEPRPPDARIPWAELLRRVFRLDVLACPCGGRRKVLAFITERSVARSILDAMGLPSAAPPISPARLRCEPGVELWQDDVPALQLR